MICVKHVTIFQKSHKTDDTVYDVISLIMTNLDLHNTYDIIGLGTWWWPDQHLSDFAYVSNMAIQLQGPNFLHVGPTHVVLFRNGASFHRDTYMWDPWTNSSVGLHFNVELH